MNVVELSIVHVYGLDYLLYFKLLYLLFGCTSTSMQSYEAIISYVQIEDII